MHTGRWTVEQAGGLVGNLMDKPIKRCEVDLADQQTSRYEHVDKLAEHHNGWAGKSMHLGERIMVDGITEEGLCPLSGGVY